MVILHFAVQGYDSRHLTILEKSPYFSAIKLLLANGLTTSDYELLIHTMFNEQDGSREGFRSYKELADRASSRGALFYDYFAVHDRHLHAVGQDGSTRKTQTERLGEACAILTMNQVLGVTEADWQRIPETNVRRTLDFCLLCSDGQRLVALEAKGTIASQPHLASSGSTSGMKGEIEGKKGDARRSGWNAIPLFGVITAVGDAQGVPPVVRLLDPPAWLPETDPVRFRILARLLYYLRHLALVSRFHMLTALRDRIAVLERVRSIDDLDGLELQRPFGEAFRLPDTFSPNGPLFQIGTIVGRLLPPARRGDRRLFIGFEQSLFNTLVKMSFQPLIEWRKPPAREQTVRIAASEASGEFTFEPGPRRAPPPTRGTLKFGTNSAGIAMGWFSSEEPPSPVIDPRALHHSAPATANWRQVDQLPVPDKFARPEGLSTTV